MRDDFSNLLPGVLFGGGGGGSGGGVRVTPSKEKGKNDRLIAGYDLSCKPAIQRSCWGAFFV